MSIISRRLHGKEGKSLREAIKEAHHPVDFREEEETENEEDKAADALEEAVEEDPDQEYEIVEREILPAKIICPDCGGITLEGLDFCDKCGGEL